MSGPTLSRPVGQCYTPEKFRQLLADAETTATHGHSDWDRTFITDMQSRYRHYGDSMQLSTLQRHHLERIANHS